MIGKIKPFELDGNLLYTQLLRNDGPELDELKNPVETEDYLEQVELDLSMVFQYTPYRFDDSVIDKRFTYIYYKTGHTAIIAVPFEVFGAVIREFRRFDTRHLVTYSKN